jgi:pimeloyl-ACP methyl ester carboxylesterase
MLASDPNALRGSFGQYRAWDVNSAQNEQRKTRKLTLPVLAIGGAKGIGQPVVAAMKLVADDVEPLIIPDCGHWLAEEAPDQMVAALTAFLAPYRDGAAAARNLSPHAAGG